VVSDLPINTCLLSSRPKPTPSSCPWGAESTPKDAGRTPRFLRFQVKSRTDRICSVFSRGSCLRISFFLSADFFLSWPLLGCRVPITVRSPVIKILLGSRSLPRLGGWFLHSTFPPRVP